MVRQKLIALTLITLLIFSGCSQGVNLNEINKESLPLEIAKLSLLNFNTVDSFETFKELADNLNLAIEILNEKSKTQIDFIEPTKETWNSISKVLTEYAPLIDNYNQLVSTAKDFDIERTEFKLNEFYLASSKFGIELALIMGTVFYGASYNIVKYVYFNSGMTRFALKCSTCVSTVLGQAHWTIRNYFVASSAIIAEGAIRMLQNSSETMKIINNEYHVTNKTNNIFNNVKRKIENY